MNALLLLPLLLAAAPAPTEPVPTVPVEVDAIELSTMEMGCGGSGPVFADRSPLVDADALAAVDPAVAPVPTAEPVAIEAAPARDADAPPAVAASRPFDRRCLAETGTRIRGVARRCDAQAGDAYDRDEIDRTGAVTTAEALRRLSPTVTIR